MNNFKTLVGSFAAALVVIWALAFFADWIHPRLGCLPIEKQYWSTRPEPYNFERVSSFYWSSLCREKPLPLIISASEGRGVVSFPELALNWGIIADEFNGAHRGLKTLAYILASAPSEERLSKMRVLAFINPVYFSFASKTDSSSVRLVSISNLSYFSRLPSFHQKWDEFILSSPFIGAKVYGDELSLFQTKRHAGVYERWPDLKPMPESHYSFERFMNSGLLGEYTSFNGKFSARVEPSRFLFDRVVEFAKSRPQAKICYVMLPANIKNLEYFGRDAASIAADMKMLIEKIPEGSRLDLSSLNHEPYIFMDPMHLSDFGKRRVMEEVMKSGCGEKVFGKVAP